MDNCIGRESNIVARTVDANFDRQKVIEHALNNRLVHHFVSGPGSSAVRMGITCSGLTITVRQRKKAKDDERRRGGSVCHSSHGVRCGTTDEHTEAPIILMGFPLTCSLGAHLYHMREFIAPLVKTNSMELDVECNTPQKCARDTMLRSEGTVATIHTKRYKGNLLQRRRTPKPISLTVRKDLLLRGICVI